MLINRTSLGKVLTLFLVVFVTCLYGQEYAFRHFNVAHGLGSASINHIFQDSRGYIWFATQNGGVSRFDGKSFITFKKADGLVGNDVTYITEAKDGHIWIATSNGVSEYNGHQFKSYFAANNIENGVIYCIVQDTDNKIWFATQQGGIKILKNGKIDSITIQHGLPSNSVYTLQKDHLGRIWIGGAGGVACYSNNKIISYSNHSFVKNKTFFSSSVDNTGAIWFGSITGDVIKVNANNQIERIQLPHEVKNDFIGCIAQDKKGNMWFATDHGLLKYSNGFQLFNTKHGLSVNAVQTVMCDYEGKIWCGTLSGGSNLLLTEAFVKYSTGLLDANVTAVVPGKLPDEYYIGTGNGMYVFHPNSEHYFNKVKFPNEISEANISSISTNYDGSIWITAEEGVFVLTRKNNSFQLKKTFTEINGVPLISPLKAVHDKKGNTYIATFGSGVLTVGINTVTLQNTSTGLPSNNILTAFVNSKDDVWFGTLDAGLLKLTNKHITRTNVTLIDKSIWAISELPNGELLLGTGESGLIVTSNNARQKLRYKNISRLKHIPAIAFDKVSKVLWLGGDMGIERVPYSSGQFRKSIFFGNLEGFPSITVNQNGLYAFANGKLLICSTNGIWSYLPSENMESATPPKTILTEIRLFFRETDWSKYTSGGLTATGLPVNLKLPHNQNHLTFKIQALTTDNVKYMFKLEGQDADWTAPSTFNEVTYSNISSGKSYLLKGKAINSAGVSSNEVSFPFTVQSPWWDTWQLKIASIFILMCILFVFIRIREQTLRNQNKRLENVVQERIAEIAEQKKAIESSLLAKEILLKQKDVLLKEIHHRVKNNLQTISSILMLQSSSLKDEVAKRAIAESQSRVRSIALIHQKLYQTDGLEKIELSAFTKELCNQVHTLYKPDSFSLQLNLRIPEQYILIDTAIPLGLILNELLTNSFKYAFERRSMGKIEIALAVEPEKGVNINNIITLTYFDDGPGLPDSQSIDSPKTLGLRLVLLLAKQISSEVKYNNNNGSMFTFIFKTNT